MKRDYSNDFLWSERYRPRTIDECILPKSLKKTFTEVLEKEELPNMLFTGTAGLGKTTVARALCEQLGIDYIIINGSEEGNIDTLRTKIKRFASTVSLEGGIKVVILDEADYLNPQSTQPALRGFIEEFSNNCRFILTCNFKNRIIEPLHSRCGVYEFNTSKKEIPYLQQAFLKRLSGILDTNEVQYDTKTLVEMIVRFAPDWRRILNEVQRFSMSGVLEPSVLESASSDEFNRLLDYMKDKNFKGMRKWVADNIDVDASAIFRGIYDRMNDRVEPSSIPQLVIILADYQYKNAFVADHELNIVACLTEAMANVEFK